MKIVHALAIIFVKVGFYLRYLFAAVILAADKGLDERRCYYLNDDYYRASDGTSDSTRRQFVLPGGTFCEKKNKCLCSVVVSRCKHSFSFYSTLLYFLSQ